MNKIIFFTNLSKLSDALENVNIDGFRGKKVPLKLHMGEIGNKYFPQPDFVKTVVNHLKHLEIIPFLYDTTVAYSGLRHSVSGYYKVAHQHGFFKKQIGCEVVIDDKGIPVRIEDKNYEVAQTLHASTHIVALSHVKGHIATGMGGAIKNLGMGGVTKETKRTIHHGSRPQFQTDACTFCGVCAEVCPFDAITLTDNSWNRVHQSCFGCGVCVENCQPNALTYEDGNLQYLLACAAKACVGGKNVIYINELKRIAKGCDCDPHAGPLICPDIGYLFGNDPVAIDKASLDLIHNVKKDLFENIHHVDPLKQITYGEEIGLGSLEYELIEI